MIMRVTLYALPVLSKERSETIGRYAVNQVFVYYASGSKSDLKWGAMITYVDDRCDEPVEDDNSHSDVCRCPPGYREAKT